MQPGDVDGLRRHVDDPPATNIADHVLPAPVWGGLLHRLATGHHEGVEGADLNVRDPSTLDGEALQPLDRGIVAEHLSLIPLSAREVRPLFDHRGDLLPGEPVPLNHGGEVGGEKPRGLAEAGEYDGRDRQVLDGLPGRFDPHQVGSGAGRDPVVGLERHSMVLSSASVAAVIVPLNGR
ncbi:hypothetical protein ACYOEI_16020 [Singulisphaera rosea]